MVLRLTNVLDSIVEPALRLLPPAMTSDAARTMMLAIGLQESRFEHRRQLGDGPARGFWQFEVGGVTGVWKHSQSSEQLRLLCRERDCEFSPRAIWASLERDDILAAGVARLLLWTDAKPLPAMSDPSAAWDCYVRNWRPGKPHPASWPELHRAAREMVLAA